MSQKKVCPIVMAAPNNPNFRCIGWECAWWCEKENECAVLVTAETLKDGDT
jgi:hypothetical protein